MLQIWANYMAKQELSKIENQTENTTQKLEYISDIYKEWLLDYSSYLILGRAVPYIDDGMKPVQRRIMHVMYEMDDGRYHKVANIIGQTMKYHPHGDASIGDALVKLGQKELLVDTQGNWGNLLTGDGAAAPRYIEARLTPFAREVIFNPKTTIWKKSYDGRNNEPVCLPVKFPLLLAQGVEGIALGLASKILPHNFIELLDASIAYLRKKEFTLFPDFPTGGSADFSNYNDGLRGGKVRIRAHVSKESKNTLAIHEVPYGCTTSSLIDSILSANDKGKIKIKHVEDNTSEKVEIIIHLAPGISADQTIDALYAFTDCEISISPNSCVVSNESPQFLGVTDILKQSTDKTVSLLKTELEIRLNELNELWHKTSLERIFIQEQMYKKAGYEKAPNNQSAIKFLLTEFESFAHLFKRKVTSEDVAKLFEVKMGRILKYNIDKAENYIDSLEGEMAEIKNHLEHLVDYAINYFKQIKKKYGTGKERKTEIKSFETIEAAKVIVANKKLYVNAQDGFVGTSLKSGDYLCDCSELDEIIVFKADGNFMVTKVDEKVYVGKNPLYVNIFKRNDKRTTYHFVYSDGPNGVIRAKRFNITAITRDKDYDLTKGTPGSKVLYFSVNPNAETEIITISHRLRPRLKKLNFDFDFAEMAIKGRNSQGNILTRLPVKKIKLKEKAESTLGGKKIWYDQDVNRLNDKEIGRFLGKFSVNDNIITINKDGMYQISGFELTTHFDENLIYINKRIEKQILTLIYLDKEQEYLYIKRFEQEDSTKPVELLPSENCEIIQLLTEQHPVIEVVYDTENTRVKKDKEVLLIEDFIAVKGIQAKGKRLSQNKIKTINILEPIKENTIEVEEDTTNIEGSDIEDDNVSENQNENGNNNNETQLSINFDDL